MYHSSRVSYKWRFLKAIYRMSKLIVEVSRSFRPVYTNSETLSRPEALIPSIPQCPLTTFHIKPNLTLNPKMRYNQRSQWLCGDKCLSRSESVPWFSYVLDRLDMWAHLGIVSVCQC